MMKLALLLAPALLSGCSVLSALDFGGDDKKAWEFRFGWDHGVAQAAAGTKPGAVDENGVYKPETPEAESILGFPNIHAGVAGEIYPKGRITPVVQVTACDVKVPYLRWFSVQVGAGANLAEVYIGKRLVSVYEITAGPWFGRDFDTDRWAYGVAFTLIKF